MLKWHAAAEGLWRTVTDFWGNRHPISESLASIEEEANLIRLAANACRLERLVASRIHRSRQAETGNL